MAEVLEEHDVLPADIPAAKEEIEITLGSGAVLPSMQGCEGAFGVPHPQRGRKKTQRQEPGVEGKMAEVLAEHDVIPADMPPVEEKIDITLVDDGEVEIQNGRVIALDFDDVCCQSMAALCQEHNALWGTNMNV